MAIVFQNLNFYSCAIVKLDDQHTHLYVLFNNRLVHSSYIQIIIYSKSIKFEETQPSCLNLQNFHVLTFLTSYLVPR
jgi:hypothetical protein